MTGYLENAQKPQLLTLNPLLIPGLNFFQVLAVSLSLFYSLLASCKVLEKINEQSLRYLKTDRQTDGQGRLPWTPLGEHGVQNDNIVGSVVSN